MCLLELYTYLLDASNFSVMLVHVLKPDEESKYNLWRKYEVEENVRLILFETAHHRVDFLLQLLFHHINVMELNTQYQIKTVVFYYIMLIILTIHSSSIVLMKILSEKMSRSKGCNDRFKSILKS